MSKWHAAEKRIQKKEESVLCRNIQNLINRARMFPEHAPLSAYQQSSFITSGLVWQLIGRASAAWQPRKRAGAASARLVRRRRRGRRRDARLCAPPLASRAARCGRAPASRGTAGPASCRQFDPTSMPNCPLLPLTLLYACEIIYLLIMSKSDRKIKPNANSRNAARAGALFASISGRAVYRVEFRILVLLESRTNALITIASGTSTSLRTCCWTGAMQSGEADWGGGSGSARGGGRWCERWCAIEEGTLAAACLAGFTRVSL